MIPLKFTSNGDRVKIIKINGGNSFKRKLSEMGLYIGSDCKIINNIIKGPIIIEKENYRIGIGFNMSLRIFVKIIEKGENL